MDLDAVLARQPAGRARRRAGPHQRARLAATPSAGRTSRSCSTPASTCITTVNIQHLESLNDVVEQITGVPQRETVPDEVVRARRPGRAGRHDARRRCAGGWRTATSTSRRRSTPRCRQLLPGRQPHRAARAGAALAGRQGRRAARPVPRRARHRRDLGDPRAGRRRADRRPRGRHPDPPRRPDRRPRHRRRPARRARRPQRRPDRRRTRRPWPASARWSRASAAPTTRSSATTSRAALLDFARGVNATQLVLGARRRGRLAQLLSPGIGVDGDRARVRRRSTCTWSPTSRPPRRARLPAASAGLHPAAPARPALALAPVAAAAAHRAADACCATHLDLDQRHPAVPRSRWSRRPASAGSGRRWPPRSVGSLLLNYFFTPPAAHAHHRRARRTCSPCVVFVAVAAIGQLGRRPRRPPHAARPPGRAPRPRPCPPLAGSVLRGETGAAGAAGAGPGDLRHDVGDPAGARERRRPRGRARAGWRLGPGPAPARGRGRRRAGRRRPGPRAARPGAAAPRTAGCSRRSPPRPRSPCGSARLAEAAAAAEPLAEADRIRTALLAAVSHDLRTPLASAKAAVSALRSRRRRLVARRTAAELLATADESLDRLTRLVDNLLDMSRLQAGALAVLTAAGRRWTRCVPRALDELGPDGQRIELRLPDDAARGAPPTRACWSGSWPTWSRTRCGTRPADRRRRWSPPARSATGSRSGSSTADPASPEADWERIFLPFQRLGDRDNATPASGSGSRCPAASPRRWAARSTPEDTPGGGLTMVLSLPAAPAGEQASLTPSAGEPVEPVEPEGRAVSSRRAAP